VLINISAEGYARLANKKFDGKQRQRQDLVIIDGKPVYREGSIVPNDTLIN